MKLTVILFFEFCKEDFKKIVDQREGKKKRKIITEGKYMRQNVLQYSTINNIFRH